MTTTHRIAQGECLSSIAKKYGFADYTLIFDHAENAGFKRKHPNPNVLRPGETLIIPDKLQKTVSCATGKMHIFKVKDATTKLRIKFADDGDNAFSGKKYQLTVGGRTLEGTTDADGLVEQQIPADATTGELVIFLSEDEDIEGHVFPLQLGHLDPPDMVSGAQARLLNLGYDCGEVSGTLDDKTRAALEAFQSHQGLEVTGTLDANTSDKLRQLHED